MIDVLGLLLGPCDDKRVHPYLDTYETYLAWCGKRINPMSETDWWLRKEIREEFIRTGDILF